MVFLHFFFFFVYFEFLRNSVSYVLLIEILIEINIIYYGELMKNGSIFLNLLMVLSKHSVFHQNHFG